MVAMAGGTSKVEVKTKIQNKAHSAISDLITLEKVVIRSTKSKDVSCAHRFMLIISYHRRNI